jgi:hypothetical protein
MCVLIPPEFKRPLLMTITFYGWHDDMIVVPQLRRQSSWALVCSISVSGLAIHLRANGLAWMLG